MPTSTPKMFTAVIYYVVVSQYLTQINNSSSLDKIIIFIDNIQ